MIRKYWKYMRFIVVPLIVFVVCAILYTVLDLTAMGVLADWADKMFMYEESWPREDGSTVIVHNFSWDALKTYLFDILAVLLPLTACIVMVIADIRKRRIRTQTSHQIAGYLQRYLLQKEPLPLEFPQEYAEVVAKISEVSHEIDRQAQILREESQRKNDLITYLAHDLKTPLTSIIGYLTLLKDEPDISETHRMKYTEIAVKKADRLENLINELFEITRFNLSKIELQTETVNLSRMTEQIAYEFSPLLTEKNLHFIMEIEPDISLDCDVDKMERILDNMIRNAVSYSYPDSDIQIQLTRNADDVLLKFTNRGKTIPKEKLTRIFEQFFRLDTSRSTATGGSGLGLAITKQLVEAHGGTICAESENEQIRFTLTFPINRHKIV